MFSVRTRNETYFVDANGFIGRPLIGMKPSGRWKMRGLVRLNNLGQEVHFVPFARLAEFVAGNPAWTHKNGKPRYFLADNDCGTDRLQMDGVFGICASPDFPRFSPSNHR